MNPAPDQPHGPCWSLTQSVAHGFHYVTHISMTSRDRLACNGKACLGRTQLTFPLPTITRCKKAVEENVAEILERHRKTAGIRSLAQLTRLKERPRVSENIHGENRQNSAAGTMKLCSSGHLVATISRVFPPARPASSEPYLYARLLKGNLLKRRDLESHTEDDGIIEITVGPGARVDHILKVWLQGQPGKHLSVVG